MIVRRVPMLAVTVVAAAAIVVAAPDAPEPTAPTFAEPSSPWMPAAPTAASLTNTWFCPGVPASGEEGTSGEFVIANAGQVPMTGRVTLLAGEGQSVEQPFDVAPYARVTINPASSVTAPYVAAVVEIDGGGGLVEQRSTQPAGTSVAPCTTSTSKTWYLAEGFTAEDSTEQLVLANPYSQTVIVDIGTATDEGSRQPPELQGFPIPARSVQIIDMDAVAARDEAQVAVSVVASRGTLLVGRAQLYDGGGRLGYSMTLASPTTRSQWWFANGERAPGVAERFSIYNPTENDVQVTPVFLGVASEVLTDSVAIPAGEVVTFPVDSIAGLPDGRHAMVFGTDDGSESLIVERAITRTIDGIPTTSVIAGAVPSPTEPFVPNTWTLAIGPGEATPDGLIVYNSAMVDATVTVQAVTSNGVQSVPGLEALPLAAGGLLPIALTDASAIDAQLIVRSTSPVFVERSLPREPGAQGRSTSWALPVVD